MMTQGTLSETTPACGAPTGSHDFSLTTTWHLDAPLPLAWAAIEDVANWPQWWPYVADVALLVSGDAQGLGSIRRLRWRTALPYTLSFDACVTGVQAPFAIDARVSGDLNGIGRWRLSRAGAGTLARYHWEVSAARAWMRRLTPWVRPLFEWNHQRVMDAGERGLARRLKAKAP